VAVTRPERITFLLEHFHDVLAGLRDQGNRGRARPADVCRVNSAGYQELERLLPLLSAASPPLYRAVVGMWVHPRFVRRAVCPKCGAVKPPRLVGELHLHGHRRSAGFVARMVRVPLYPVYERYPAAVVAWLDEHWRGEPFIPDELLPLVGVA
jgi:hypothetical protein